MLTTNLVGMVAGTTGTGMVVAAAAAADPSGIGPYVGGGAGVIAVAALGEVTRRLLNGRLIPRETKEAEQEMAAYIIAAGQREDRAMRLVEDTGGMAIRAAQELRDHNARLAADLAEVSKRQVEHTDQAVMALRQVVEDLRDEVRQLRRGPL